MLKIHIKQNVNFLKINEKEPNENVRKIQNLSLNTGKKLSIFLKILTSKILKINLKYLLYLMIWMWYSYEQKIPDNSDRIIYLEVLN